ncbi:MAG: glycosyltransferase [Candidatus Omnitrophota bacterium]
MKNYPFCSVLMPVYNGEKYLKEAIESILGQTFPDFEFIIINDGSTDGTKWILDFYSRSDSRIKVLTQGNRGIVSALNNGLKLCKGEWVFRMDSDDIAIPNRLQLQLNEIREKPDLALVGGFCEQINENNIILRSNKYPAEHKTLINNLESLKPFLPTPTICFKRVAVNEVSGYRERFKYADDIDLWLRLAEKGRFCCVQEVVTKLRKHSSNFSTVHFKEFQIYGDCAVVCYFRRKMGLSDPSSSDNITWHNFKGWVESRLDEMGIFEEEAACQLLRDLWISNAGIPLTKKLISLLKNCKIEFLLLKYVFRRFSGNIAYKLAVQSKGLFK